MTTTPGQRFERAPHTTDDHSSAADRAVRAYTASERETKPGFLTSEFISSIVVSVGVLIAAAVEEGFAAQEAWTIIAALSIGYMLSRGFAKMGVARRDGSRDLR